MLKTGTGYSKNKSAETAAGAAAENAMKKAGISRANAVIVFASTRYRRSYQTILNKIQAVTNAQTIVGASGHGILTEEAEIERQNGIGVMVIASDTLNAESFMISNLQENNLAAGEKAGKLLREKIQAKLMLLFPDPFSFVSPLFFDGFKNAYGYIPMIGGAAAEEGKESKTYQFEGTQASFDSVAGLALGGNFHFETGITRSCRPFGEPLQITRSDGHTIYEMDGRPAYDILLESISHIECDNPNDVFKNIFIGVPMKNFQTDFSGDHYLVRNIMGVNAKKGHFTCTSPLEVGEFITFTFRDPNLARQDLRVTLEDLRERFGDSKPVMGFYFNCCARGELLYGTQGQDVALIREYFPGVPILGFFSFGELAPVDHVNHMHHQAGVLTLLAEK